MGTVGLSFGSPTSGTGFDVSATVASIVSGLQDVETPWETQLTSLESEDSVISNLGSLLADVSNAMSDLTNIEGVLSEKTGSSSDENVLELTAASSSAIAGTHTVVVNSLAQTSSGYLAPIANASDTLAGAITLQVGSGQAQTFTLDSSDDTLAGLAAAINASSVGIDASVLTDASGSRLSLVSGTSGADGDITVTANSISDTSGDYAAPLTYSDPNGYTDSTADSGTLGEVVGESDILSGTLTIGVGSGTAQTFTLDSSDDTLSTLASTINSADLGVTASVVQNEDGTYSLSLQSQTDGAAGALSVTSTLGDTANTTLGYTAAVTGSNASLVVDGVSLTSASNTVTDLIPGVTFQLLSTSPTESDGSSEQVQVVIGNDNADVESTVSVFVNDYNALVSAINAQEGDTSSGTAEPLFGSPTLTLLQEQLLGALNTQNPNGYLDSVASPSDTLSGSITISLADGLTLGYSGAAGTDIETSTGTLNPIQNAGDTLSGSISIQVGSGTAETVNVGDSSTPDTLAGLATAINDADIGVTASIVTNSDGSSSLSLLSGTAGTAGTLTVTSSIVDTSPQTVDVPTTSGDNTLAGLASAINSAEVGVTATVVSTSTGSQLELASDISGSAGALTVTSNVTDTTAGVALGYNNNDSDINSLTSLGISVNDDGTLTFDADELNSVLNTDYNSVVSFFQNADSWGQNFSTVLTNAGTSSPTGVLALASSSDSSIESTLNSEISNQNSLISVEQSSLTAELNSANEVMEEIPSQLDGINELYSAITGYDENET